MSPLNRSGWKSDQTAVRSDSSICDKQRQTSKSQIFHRTLLNLQSENDKSMAQLQIYQNMEGGGVWRSCRDPQYKPSTISLLFLVF